MSCLLFYGVGIIICFRFGRFGNLNKDNVSTRKSRSMAEVPEKSIAQPIDQSSIMYIHFPTEHCQACDNLTSDLYSRTVMGKKYCIDCLNKGAGVDEYLNTSLEVYVGKELKELARKNGFIN